MDASSSLTAQEHWARVYSSSDVERVSWYQEDPTESLAMIARAAVPPARVIDVGGGTSRLVDQRFT